MYRFIKNLKAIGIYGRFDINLDLRDGINIIHGSNGTGKTTLLHILANAVNEDFERFVYLKFRELAITLDDDTKILIKQQESPEVFSEKITKVFINEEEKYSYPPEVLSKKEKLRKSIIELEEMIDEIHRGFGNEKENIKKQKYIDLGATYFPAFRTMIEAWATLDENEIRNISRRSPNLRKAIRSSEKSTELARILFGKFVPRLEYPSPIEIQEHINSELTEAQLKIARLDRDLLSQAFLEFSTAISQSDETDYQEQDPEEIITEIRKLSEKLKNSSFQVSFDNSDDVYEKLIKKLESFESDPKYRTIASRVLSVYKNSLQKRLDEQTKAYSSIKTYIESVINF